jgi:hypothetical protein
MWGVSHILTNHEPPSDPNKRTANDVLYICRILKKLDVFENKDIHLYRSDVLEGVKRWKLSLFQRMSNK